MIVETGKALKELMQRARERSAVGLDTEFVWERTYYPRLGLVQVGFSETQVYLVDVTVIDDLSSLGDLLADPSVVKVLHDAQQDLTILRRATGSYPCRLFDTRLAAGFTGRPSILSLSDLMKDLFGVEMDKSQSRTDWLRRPLSEDQEKYALEDVRYLVKAVKQLTRNCRSAGLESWLVEEMNGLDDPGLYKNRSSREQFLRIRGTGRFTARDLAILRELAAWRDREARQINRPRGRVIADKTLLDIVRSKPRSEQAVRKIKSISSGQRKRYATRLLELVATGLEIPESSCPEPLKASAARAAPKEVIDRVLEAIRAKCDAVGIDPSLVATRGELTAVSRGGRRAAASRNRVLKGWRLEFLGDMIDPLREWSNTAAGKRQKPGTRKDHD